MYSDIVASIYGRGAGSISSVQEFRSVWTAGERITAEGMCSPEGALPGHTVNNRMTVSRVLECYF